MQSDIEIANAAVLRPIREIAHETLGIAEEHLVPYGHHKAKVDIGYLSSLADRPLGRLVLVTALSPTPPGEGKTTTCSRRSSTTTCTTATSSTSTYAA